MSTPKADARSFARWVALITAVGLVGRVAYVLFVTRHYTVWGDAYFYHESSNLIADGKGFINPIDWIENHVRIQAADHPPLYLIYLAGWSLIGVTSTTGHMLVSVLLGAATIAVTAYAGRGDRRAARGTHRGRRSCAIYPNVWAPDGMLLSETMAILTVALTMLLVYRFWHRPSLARAAWMGVAVGLATLSRSELILLSVLVIVPLGAARAHRARSAVGSGWIAAAAATCVGVVGPWVVFNMTRFDHPVYLSAGYEITLSTATCDLTWYGEFTGYWNIQCPIRRAPTARRRQPRRRPVRAREALPPRLDRLHPQPREAAALRGARTVGPHHRPLQAAAADEPRPLPRGTQHLGRSLCSRGVVHRRSARDRRRVRAAEATHPGVPAPRSPGHRVRSRSRSRSRRRATGRPPKGAICLLAAVGVDALVRMYERLRDDPEDAPPLDERERELVDA